MLTGDLNADRATIRTYFSNMHLEAFDNKKPRIRECVVWMLNRSWPAMLVADGVQQKRSFCVLCIHSDGKQLPHTLAILNCRAFGEVVCPPCFSGVCVFSFKTVWPG